MKKLWAASGAVFLFLLVVPAFAIDVTGELVDLSCYNKDKVKNVGAAHQDCAMTCAKKGMTVALVTENGEMYTIGGDLAANNNARIVKHMSHKMAVQGSLAINTDGTKTIMATTMKMISK